MVRIPPIGSGIPTKLIIRLARTGVQLPKEEGTKIHSLNRSGVPKEVLTDRDKELADRFKFGEISSERLSTEFETGGKKEVLTEEFVNQLNGDINGQRREEEVRTQQKALATQQQRALELSQEPSYMQVARGLTPEKVAELKAQQPQHFGFYNQRRIGTVG